MFLKNVPYSYILLLTNLKPLKISANIPGAGAGLGEARGSRFNRFNKLIMFQHNWIIGDANQSTITRGIRTPRILIFQYEVENIYLHTLPKLPT